MFPPLAGALRHTPLEVCGPLNCPRDPLVVSCSDFSGPLAKIRAGLGTGTLLMRTPGNLVPFCSEVEPRGTALEATLEFALVLRGVRDIVVLGHTCCPTLERLLAPRGLRQRLPWERETARARYLLAEHYVDLSEDERALAATGENTLAQVERLSGYPLLKTRAVRLHAWIYDEFDAQTYAYDPLSASYLPITVG